MSIFKNRKKEAKAEHMPDAHAQAGNGAAAVEYPYAVKRRLQGYIGVIVVFGVLAVLSFAFTKSLISSLFAVFLMLAMGGLYVLQKKNLEKTGYKNWHFRVVDYTYLTKINRKPTGFYAEALDGDYEGKMCHIALAGSSATPPLNEEIELCVPGDTMANPIRDVLYIPQYYGIRFLGTGVSADAE